MEETRAFSSFRDPSGFLFYRGGSLFRQVNKVYREDFELMINSGLYKKLVGKRLLISYSGADIPPFEPEKAYKVIQPEIIPFISYPYEWSFSQLKDAALAILEIQKTAFEFGMSLKDCSAYNIQFYNGRPILIDTLSLQKYQAGEPWVAYRQFCQHFLAPLALMSLKDIRFNQLLRIYLDGIPLDFAKKMLPFKISLFPHIHLHASVQSYFQDKQVKTSAYKVSNVSFRGLVDSLESAVSKLRWSAKGTEWGDYYDNTSYSSEAFEDKKAVVGNFLEKIKPRNCWDLGANQGVFSRIAADKGINVVSFDSDPAAVENNYLECVKRGAGNILPLLIDLANPSPSIGWQNRERDSFIERGPADVVLALALIHHLAISHNLPLGKIAEFLSGICEFLIVEFVPKDDPQIKRLLATRKDIFDDYSRESFEREFSKLFALENSARLRDSGRNIYLMRKKRAEK